jgi:argininosuccinate lyase
MPQKKNPDVLELTRGKCGRVYGSLVSLLTTFKGLPLAYNRDMQEDKEPLFDAVDTVESVLGVMRDLVHTVGFHTERTAQACDGGHMDATSLAEYLVRKGVPFREAHGIVGRAVRAAGGEDRLSELTLEQLQEFSDAIEEDVFDILGTRECVENYQSHGSTAPSEVDKQIAMWRQRLEG